jgi:hypothetical protein
MLDVAGMTRGGDTNEATALAEAWKSTSVTNFSSPQALKSWEEDWGNSTKGYQVKVVYNKAAAELVVLGKGRGREFKKSFSVDSGLQQALVEAQRFIAEETKK